MLSNSKPKQKRVPTLEFSFYKVFVFECLRNFEWSFSQVAFWLQEGVYYPSTSSLTYFTTSTTIVTSSIQGWETKREKEKKGNRIITEENEGRISEKK